MSTNYQFVDFTEGFGAGTMNDVQQLNKAIEAGSGYTGAPSALTGGGALQVESLDASLKSVTFEMKDIKLWGMIAKTQAFNTVEEYNRVSAYGDAGQGFIAEGALPRSQDAQYSRQVARIRFIGVTRELTHVYTLVRNAHGDAMAQQIRNGTMKILEITERALHDGRGFYSNAGVFDGGASILDADIAWEGADLQIRKGDTDLSATDASFSAYGATESIVQDMRGAILDEDVVEDAARIALENHGMPNLLEMETKAHTDLSKQFYPKERVNPMGVQQGRAGFVLREFDSSAGQIQLISNIFIRPKLKANPVFGGPVAPSAPTAVVASSAISKFAAADAGAYFYAVTALTAIGESAISASSSSVANLAGSAATLTISAVTGAYAYGVYRTAKGAAAGTEQFIGFVAPASVGASATFVDANAKLQGTSQAYMFTQDAEVMAFKQLAPLMKMDLAIVATAFRWMQLLYGTVIFYAPRKCGIIENIGRAS